MPFIYTIQHLTEGGGERHSHTLNCAGLNDAVAVAIAEKIECARIEISLADKVVWRRVPRSFLEVSDGTLQAHADAGRIELS